ncbi:thioredoxin family protein [Edaphobacter albus]|uniref:thioredoxin family protein n=1 Tax=Edaphobacter sp. 4G125 TaxID=2763071 RepID=UPI001644FDBB|nr:thioredoxin family protein [Edaphobacter sp. 4G125]QNI37871.1 thioredoxin family protein [Edaphobacter sp. 4G125]
MLNRFRTIPVMATVLVSMATFPAATQMKTPFVKKHLYSSTADPKADIAAALKQAKAEKKRVILDFGGDWCGDCQVLDIYMHESPNTELIAKHFVVVHIDIGRMDHNVDVADKYKVPIKKGVPALAVLDANGRLLYSQQNKEFENMENMKSSDVTAFLRRWKG